MTHPKHARVAHGRRTLCDRSKWNRACALASAGSSGVVAGNGSISLSITLNVPKSKWVSGESYTDSCRLAHIAAADKLPTPCLYLGMLVFFKGEEQLLSC